MPFEVQLRVVGAVLHPGDRDAPQGPAQRDDQCLAEIVREGALSLDLIHLHDNRLRFRLADPDRQHARAVCFPQHDDVRACCAVEPESGHGHFHHRHLVAWPLLKIKRRATER